MSECYSWAVQSLEELRLAHGTGSALLAHLLETAAELPNLRTLALSHWHVPSRAANAAAPHWGGGAAANAVPPPQGNAPGQGGGPPSNEGGTTSSSALPLSTLDVLRQALALPAPAQDEDADDAFRVAAAQGGPAKPKPKALWECLAQIQGLRRLEVVASTPAVVEAVRLCAVHSQQPMAQGDGATAEGGAAVPGGLGRGAGLAESLRELRLSVLPSLTHETLAGTLRALTALTRLELAACGPAAGPSFRSAPVLLRPEGAGGVADRVSVVWDEEEDAAYGAHHAGGAGASAGAGGAASRAPPATRIADAEGDATVIAADV